MSENENSFVEQVGDLRGREFISRLKNNYENYLKPISNDLNSLDCV